jgi:ribosomal protein S24E
LEPSRKTESKLLERVEVEFIMPGKAGKLTRKEAIEMVANEMSVEPSKVGLVSLGERSGTTDVWGRFMVYASPEAMKRVHPEHLSVRLLTKDEREKLKQAKKKAAQPQAEAK